MDAAVTLPGLERLLDVCQRLKLGLKTTPPARTLRKAGSLLEGVPFDPVLADVYARLGHAAFATNAMGWVLTRSTDEAHDLEERNKQWRRRWWEELGAPMLIFGGDMGLAYTYATVPGLAGEQGRQPVVRVDTHEPEPDVMPVASDVDHFFDSYSRYLEALVAHPRYQKYGETELIFPWDATGILARDERLVEMMRAGRFEPLMKNADEETRRWEAKVMGARE